MKSSLLSGFILLVMTALAGCSTDSGSPFAARDTPSLLYAVTHDMPLRPSALAPVPAAIEQFLAIALAKSRDARFQTATELVAAFQAAHDGALPDDLARRAATQPAWREPSVPI